MINLVKHDAIRIWGNNISNTMLTKYNFRQNFIHCGLEVRTVLLKSLGSEFSSTAELIRKVSGRQIIFEWIWLTETVLVVCVSLFLLTLQLGDRYYLLYIPVIDHVLKSGSYNKNQFKMEYWGCFARVNPASLGEVQRLKQIRGK